jgi:rRNA maturation protein Nop10
MPFDIHCPQCGEFQDKKNVSRGCPRCGNKQAISLHHRYDIDFRFKFEKENKCTTKMDVRQGTVTRLY